MLRWLTAGGAPRPRPAANPPGGPGPVPGTPPGSAAAGESHGPGLVAILEGVPAHVQVTSQDVVDALARRRLGYGRGARMKFEQDQVDIIGGLRHGETLGSPIAIRVGNTEWPKWEKVMAPDPVDE